MSKAIAMIHAFLERYPRAEYGPAHLVLSDYNLLDWDLAYCEGWLEGAHHKPTHAVSPAEYEATRTLLHALAHIPETERLAESDAVHGTAMTPTDDPALVENRKLRAALMAARAMARTGSVDKIVPMIDAVLGDE